MAPPCQLIEKTVLIRSVHCSRILELAEVERVLIHPKAPIIGSTQSSRIPSVNQNQPTNQLPRRLVSQSQTTNNYEPRIGTKINRDQDLVAASGRMPVDAYCDCIAIGKSPISTPNSNPTLIRSIFHPNKAIHPSQEPRQKYDVGCAATPSTFFVQFTTRMRPTLVMEDPPQRVRTSPKQEDLGASLQRLEKVLVTTQGSGIAGVRLTPRHTRRPLRRLYTRKGKKRKDYRGNRRRHEDRTNYYSRVDAYYY